MAVPRKKGKTHGASDGIFRWDFMGFLMYYNGFNGMGLFTIFYNGNFTLW